MLEHMHVVIHGILGCRDGWLSGSGLEVVNIATVSLGRPRWHRAVWVWDATVEIAVALLFLVVRLIRQSLDDIELFL